jgi:hypothetical protein
VKVSAMPHKVVDLNVRMSRFTERKLHLPTDKTLWHQFEDDAVAGIEGDAAASIRSRFNRPAESNSSRSTSPPRNWLLTAT